MNAELSNEANICEKNKYHWMWIAIYIVTSIITAIYLYCSYNNGSLVNSIILCAFIFIVIAFVQVFTTPIPLPPPETLPPEKRILQHERNEQCKSEQRQRWMIFSYGFMLVSILGVVYIFSSSYRSTAYESMNVTAPLAVFVGCSKDENARDIRCYEPKKETPPNGEKSHISAKGATPNGRQPTETNKGAWVINIGGYVSNHDDQNCQHGTGVCVVSGGIVVPLYVIIISLLGGSVSLTRRLPEYQVQASVGYVATDEKPKLSQHQFREYLVFQIVQFMSAPLLAILAYYLVDPANIVQTVALSFTAGFASETILLMIRGVTDKLMPSEAASTKVGSVTGVVTRDSRPVEKAEVFIGASPNLRTITDTSGHYVIGNIPVGEHSISFTLSTTEKKTETFKVEKPQAVVTMNAKFESPATAALEKVASITGIVTLDGKPVDKAEVVVDDATKPGAITDKTGRYTIKNIPLGSHTIKYVIPRGESKEPLSKTETVKLDLSQVEVTKDAVFVSAKS